MFDLIFPLLLIILGVIYRINPPKNKESRFSYRTKASLKNEISWQKAHQSLGFYWIVIGVSLLVLSLVLAFIPNACLCPQLNFINDKYFCRITFRHFSRKKTIIKKYRAKQYFSVIHYI